jgi:hypothetical protein
VVNGGKIEHVGGTDMAYAIDVRTNGNLGDVKATINGGTIVSAYRAIRQFLNSTSCVNELEVTGGTIESTSGNYAVWVQNASNKANMGNIEITDGNVGRVYIYSYEMDSSALNVSINASAVEELVSYMKGYALTEVNGAYVKAEAVAKVDTYYAASLQEAINNFAYVDSTVTLLSDVSLSEGLVINKGYDFTLDLNGYTLSYESSVAGDAMITNKGELVITNGTVEYKYVGAADTSYGKGNYTISNCGTLTVEKEVEYPSSLSILSITTSSSCR